MKPSAALFRDSVSVETYAGTGAYGPTYATAVSVTCKVSTERQLVRNTAGEEVVSEATLYVQPELADPFTPESRVVIATRISTVLGVAPMSRPGETVLVKVTCS